MHSVAAGSRSELPSWQEIKDVIEKSRNRNYAKFRDLIPRCSIDQLLDMESSITVGNKIKSLLSDPTKSEALDLLSKNEEAIKRVVYARLHEISSYSSEQSLIQLGIGGDVREGSQRPPTTFGAQGEHSIALSLVRGAIKKTIELDYQNKSTSKLDYLIKSLGLHDDKDTNDLLDYCRYHMHSYSRERISSSELASGSRRDSLNRTLLGARISKIGEGIETFYNQQSLSAYPLEGTGDITDPNTSKIQGALGFLDKISDTNGEFYYGGNVGTVEDITSEMCKLMHYPRISDDHERSCTTEYLRNLRKQDGKRKYTSTVEARNNSEENLATVLTRFISISLIYCPSLEERKDEIVNSFIEKKLTERVDGMTWSEGTGRLTEQEQIAFRDRIKKLVKDGLEQNLLRRERAISDPHSSGAGTVGQEEVPIEERIEEASDELLMQTVAKKLGNSITDAERSAIELLQQGLQRRREESIPLDAKSVVTILGKIKDDLSEVGKTIKHEDFVNRLNRSLKRIDIKYDKLELEENANYVGVIDYVLKEAQKEAPLTKKDLKTMIEEGCKREHPMSKESRSK